jgi:hypothetical protein
MNSSRIFLVTYRPLVRYLSIQHIRTQGLPLFIDYSCRKEPDFLAKYPSITALCRADKFAPRLHEGDRVVYITGKGRYLGLKVPHWRFTAILRVYKSFSSHELAADWYRQKSLGLPSNCMVKGNPPSPIEHVAPIIPEFGTDIRKWDLSYALRARKTPIFHTCIPEFLELNEPSVITHEIMTDVFGRIPGTQNPPVITTAQFAALKNALHVA